MKGVFLKKDEFLETLEIENKLKKFIASFEEIFGERIIDEVFIINYKDEIVDPIYLFCAHKKCDNFVEVDLIAAEKLKNEKLKDFDFFIENILKKQCIMNNEGIIAKDQMGGLFDAMFRMDDYYIALNNSEYSFRELEEKLGIKEETFIKIVKKLYQELRG